MNDVFLYHLLLFFSAKEQICTICLGGHLYYTAVILSEQYLVHYSSKTCCAIIHQMTKSLSEYCQRRAETIP